MRKSLKISSSSDWNPLQRNNSRVSGNLPGSRCASAETIVLTTPNGAVSIEVLFVYSVLLSLMENSHRSAALLIADDGVAFLTFALVGLTIMEKAIGGVSRPLGAGDQVEVGPPSPSSAISGPSEHGGLTKVTVSRTALMASRNSIAADLAAIAKSGPVDA